MRLFKPSCAAELAEWLAENRDDTRHGLVVTGSEPDRRGARLEPMPRMVVSTGDLAEVSELRPADLTIEVGSGMRVAELGRLVWDEGLWLPFASGLGDRSVGGLVADAPPSPFDSTFGPVRRHLLACTIAHHDGRLTKWGRAVMKNVAGYDVPRLMCGSRGRLGVLTSVTLRLWPRPRQLRRFSVQGATDRLLEIPRWPFQEGIVMRGSPGQPGMDAEVTIAGGDASTRRREEDLARWAGEMDFAVEEMEDSGVNDSGAPLHGRQRSRHGAAYRVTFGRRYLSDGLRNLERRTEVAPGRYRVESFPSTGVVRVEVDGLEAAGRRKAPAWLTTVVEAPADGRRRRSAPLVGPALRVERGGPEEHAAGRRMRPAATRHFEDRLLEAFGGREAIWQADYL